MLSLVLVGAAHKNHLGPMDPSKTYPLAVLERLRTALRDQRERALVAAQGKLAQAEALLAQAAEAVAMQRQRLAQAREQQMARVGECSLVRTIELRRSYTQRVAAELAQLEQMAVQARELIAARRRELDEAQRLLQQAQTALEVIARDHASWSEQQRQEALTRAEQELEEITAARQRGA